MTSIAEGDRRLNVHFWPIPAYDLPKLVNAAVTPIWLVTPNAREI